MSIVPLLFLLLHGLLPSVLSIELVPGTAPPSTETDTEDDDEQVGEDAIEIVSVKNDKATIGWMLPEAVATATTKQRVMITRRPGETSAGAATYTVHVKPHSRQYTFDNLDGNTTYRASVEAFAGEKSLWYASDLLHTSLAALDWLAAPKDITLLQRTNTSIELSWSIPLIVQGTSSALINQHFLNVYEYTPGGKYASKRASHSIAIPKHSFIISKLSPGTVYNITLQAGTSFGYGHLAWTAVSTLVNDDDVLLSLTDVSPNFMVLAWPVHWMAAPDAKCTVKARSIRTNEELETEIVNTAPPEVNGKYAEFTIRNLRPSTAYNISVSTPEQVLVGTTGRFTRPPKMKTIWAVFNTLVQGEYTVAEPRLVVETDQAASFVWQPLQNLGEVTYQIRYRALDDDLTPHSPITRNTSIFSEELTEDQLRCPKFGCTWSCALLFNLPLRPRLLSFDVRAKVDGMWNKWTTVQRKPWNILERVCSINPPPFRVENVDDVDFQREIDVASADTAATRDVWRFLIVVDGRETGRYSTIDITKLSDKVTADFDHLPYYITGALAPAEVRANLPFRIGDGRVHGGYLNYPLADRSTDPRWSLVPLSQAENELMEPRLRTCGFNEKGSFECDLTSYELLTQLPWWAKISSFFLFLLVLAPILLCLYCVLFKFRKVKTIREETNLMYYNGEGENTAVTHEYRRKEQRGFEPSQTEERIEFMSTE